MEDSNLEKKEQFESSLKKYLGIIPHLSFIVIILGFIKQSLYYKNFNISIKNFTSLSELGLIIADDLFLIVFSLMIIFGLAELLTKHILNKLGTKLETINIIDVNGKSNFIDRFKRRYNYIGIIFSTILLIIYAVLAIMEKHFYNWLSSIALSIFFGMMLGLFFFDKHIKIAPKNKSSFNFVILLAISVILVIFWSTFEMKAVENGKYNGTIIKTNDSTYISNDTSYFIGKTEKYVFIYNSKKPSNLILPTESIKQIELVSK